MDIMAMLTKLLTKNGLIFAFVIIGITNFIAYKFAGLSKGRIHGSAVAIFFGLILAYIGGGAKGLVFFGLQKGLSTYYQGYGISCLSSYFCSGYYFGNLESS